VDVKKYPKSTLSLTFDVVSANGPLFPFLVNIACFALCLAGIQISDMFASVAAVRNYKLGFLVFLRFLVISKKDFNFFKGVLREQFGDRSHRQRIRWHVQAIMSGSTEEFLAHSVS